MSVDQHVWEQQWFPLWPLASDDLRQGIYRMSRADALEKLHIEANPQAISNLLVVDIDHDDSALRAMWNRQAWLPNAVVENPTNVHALNAEYSEPLTFAEAKAIAESIWRWITTKSRMWRDGAAVYEATFTLIQHHRGIKSGEARRAWIDELREAAQ